MCYKSVCTYFQGVISDSHSSSSVENLSPISRKKRREGDTLRKLAQKVAQQKQLIMRGLDSRVPKPQLDAQIAVSTECYKN